jgi:hypothetical protein
MNAPGTTLHPSRFRKQPVEIEAVQWGGGEVGANAIVEWITTLGRDDEAVLTPDGIAIRTLEGEMVARPGDWVIRGVQGEFYPCKPDIFRATYESATGALPPASELLEVLEGVVDCAIWQSGAVAYPVDSAWPEMREKLNRALPYVKDTIHSEDEIVGFLP